MAKFVANKTLALMLPAALAIVSASALTPVRVVQASPSATLTSKAAHNEVLARAIVQLFNEDQTLLAAPRKS